MTKCGVSCFVSHKRIQIENTPVEFAVADISEVAWEPSIFDAVSLSEDKKDMILSLAEARTGHLHTLPFDDFVPGKGRGLNVLMQCVSNVTSTYTC